MAGFVSAAIIGGGALIGGIASGVGGAIGAGKQAGAAKNAAEAQLAGVEMSIEEQKRQFDAFQKLLNPYVQQGNSSLGRLNDLMGWGGDETTYSTADGRELSGSELARYHGLNAAQGAVEAINAAGGIKSYGDWDPNTIIGAKKIEQENKHKQMLMALGFSEGDAAREILLSKQAPAGASISPFANAWKQETTTMMDDVDMTGFEGVTSQMSTGAERQQQMIDQLSNDPLLMAQIEQGEKAITEGTLSTASATGGLRGGNTQMLLAESLGKYRPQMIRDRINQEISMLSGMTQMGQNSAVGAGNAGMNFANQVGNLNMQGGNAVAQGYLAQGNAAANTANAIAGGIGGGIGGAASAGGNAYMMSQILPLMGKG